MGRHSIQNYCPIKAGVFDLPSASCLTRSGLMKSKWKHQMQAVAICIFLLLLLAAECPALDDVGLWQIITKQNFSSQITLHPHILLLVTLPWSGQARSLMKEVTRVVSGDQEIYASLKLMFMFKNLEKMLSDVIGTSSKETTILYYHHSVAYKYRGRIRAQNILLSVNPYLTQVPGELPLKHLTTLKDLEAYIDSTDKAFILLEFCGWTPKLLAKGTKNETKNAFGLQGKYANQEIDKTPTLKAKKSSKDLEIENMKCGIKHWLTGAPLLEELCSINEITFEDTESRRLDGISSCSIEEFQMFDSFFPKFINIAREFSLPSEKHRFSFITERSLLSSLGIGDVGSGFVLFVGAGSNRTMTFRDEDKIMNILQKDNPLVSELEGDDCSDIGLALPANDPSVILFVDRSSNSAGIRRTIKDALTAFRELALKFHTSNQIAENKGNVIDQASFQEYQRTQGTSGHPLLKLSSTVQMIKAKDKMSKVMLVNEGKPITLDEIVSHAQGSSLPDILSYLLQQKKEAKLSTIAQELGFRLLSDDIDIKLPHSLPFKEAEVQAHQLLPEHAQGGISTDSIGIDEDQLKYRESIHPQMNIKDSQLHNAESFSEFKSEKNIASLNSEKLISEYEQSASILESAFLEDLRAQAKSSLQVGESPVEQPHFQGLKVSFFFTDGNYRLLQSLTGGSMIPSLVVVDPILQQHYVFPDEKEITYSSLGVFLQSFLNRSLQPYQQSESVAKSHRNPVNPPFVNLKFHEVDFIPRITSLSLSELVPCLNQSKSEKVVDSRDKDVLVLFSNIWCGFCQRMELVVREVYRAMKTYITTLEKDYEDGKIVLTSERLKEEISNLPLIYLMDCTLNDCSQILKSIDQREVYPALILFLAKSKKFFLYEGDIAVTDIIRFMTEYSSNLQNLTGERGILWNADKSGGRRQTIVRDAESTSISEKSFVTTGNIHEVIMKNRISESITRFDHTEDSNISKGTAEATHHLAVGSIFVSTEKLVGVQPFDNSKILIVEVDQNRGFHGVIINKHIRWDSLQELGDGFDMLGGAPLSFGGPLVRRKMPLLALTKRVMEEQDHYPEVLPGVYFLDHSALSREIEEIKSGNYSLSDYWFFVGYSSWGWEQLFDEIAEERWSLADDSMKYFDWPENLKSFA